MLFTRRRKIEGLMLYSLNGITIQLSEKVKYLGVILDIKLLWKKYVEDNVHKGVITFCQYHKTFGKIIGP